MPRPTVPSNAVSRRRVLKTSGLVIAATVGVGRAAGEEDDIPIKTFDIQQERINPKRGLIPTRVAISPDLTDENDDVPESVYFGHFDHFDRLFEESEAVAGEFLLEEDADPESVLATPANVADFGNPHESGLFLLKFRMQDIDFSQVADGAETVRLGIGIPDDTRTSVYYVESATHSFSGDGYETAFSERRDVDDDDDE